MRFKEIERRCPLCNKYSHVALTDTEFGNYMKYRNGGITIQKALPDTEPAVREFIRFEREGYCHDCMETMFGKTSERIVDGQEGFLAFFGFEDEDFHSSDELLALENEAMNLWATASVFDYDCKIRYADKSVDIASGSVLGTSEHFVLYRKEST